MGSRPHFGETQCSRRPWKGSSFWMPRYEHAPRLAGDDGGGVGRVHRPCCVRTASEHSSRLSVEEFERQADAAVLEVVRLKKKLALIFSLMGSSGVTTSTPLLPRNLPVQLMTLLELLDVVEDKASFERIRLVLGRPGLRAPHPGLYRPVGTAPASGGGRAHIFATTHGQTHSFPCQGPYLSREPCLSRR